MVLWSPLGVTPKYEAPSTVPPKKGRRKILPRKETWGWGLGIWNEPGRGQCLPELPGRLSLALVPLGTAPGSRACWPAHAVQVQLLKIRVENLSPRLVLQEPVALATPSQRPLSRLPRLAAGPCASPLCWPLFWPLSRSPGKGGGVGATRAPYSEPCGLNVYIVSDSGDVTFFLCPRHL